MLFWTNGQFARISSFDFGTNFGAYYPAGINNANDIVGLHPLCGAAIFFPNADSFVARAGNSPSTFAPPFGLRVPQGSGTYQFSTASGINNAGQIVGYTSTAFVPCSGGVATGFCQQQLGYLKNAEGSYVRLDVEPGTSITTILTAINDSGQIVGTYYDSLTTGAGSTHGFLATPVVDTIAPMTTALVSPASNANGWNNSNTTVQFNATDNLDGTGVKQLTIVQSGAQTGSQMVGGNLAVVPVNAEGITTLTYFASDAVGNQEAPKTLLVRIDKTPPVATAGTVPGRNSNGWNNADVTVSFSGIDNLSGIDFCSAPITFTNEGSGQTANGTCTDRAGNVSAPATAKVSVDKTPPVISGMPAAGCTLWPPNQKLVTVGTITASDALSGLSPGSFKVTGTSNEPAGDSKSPDIVITPNGTSGYVVELRADRLGSGNDRIYTLNATANDLAGNTAVATTTCTVPHNQEKK